MSIEARPGHHISRLRAVQYDIKTVLGNIGKKPIWSAFTGVVGLSSVAAPVSFGMDDLGAGSESNTSEMQDFSVSRARENTGILLQPNHDDVPEQITMPFGLTDYLSGDNELGEEVNEVSRVNVEQFKTYFQAREDLGGEAIFENDAMFAQLALQVKNLADRALGFHDRQRGQGLGFTSADFDVLRDRDELRQAQRDGALITRPGEDDNRRAWAIVEARDFEEVVWRSVDEFLRLDGRRPEDPASQAERQQMFNRIVYGDFGVRPWGWEPDWREVSNNFDVCTTYMGPAGEREDQPEWSRHTNFQANLEQVDGVDQESVFNIDSNTSVLVTTVIEMDDSGNPTHLRMEVHTLSNPADPLRPDEIVVNFGDWVRVHGALSIPCGPAEVEEVEQQFQQQGGGGENGGENGQEVETDDKSGVPEHQEGPDGAVPNNEPNPTDASNTEQDNDKVTENIGDY